MEPEGETSDLDCGEEGLAVFGVSCGDAAPPFYHQEGVFHQMAELVEFFVIWPLDGTVFLRRDNDIHALGCGLLKNSISIVAFVRNQVIGVDPFDQAACLRAIRAGTFCDNNSDRQTLRIHGQMYLSVEPPFVRPIS